MKTKRNLIELANLKIILVMSVFALLTIASYSAGKTISSASKLTGIAPAYVADSVYAVVDEMPKFKDGDQGILDFISKNVIYPPEAKKNGIQGRVIVKFVVSKDGTISNPEIVKGADPLLDAEALRVVGNLPKFEKPALKAGKIVNAYYMLPIAFALK